MGRRRRRREKGSDPDELLARRRKRIERWREKRIKEYRPTEEKLLAQSKATGIPVARLIVESWNN